MKVLVACEYSGRVRDAFIAKGHDAISCDIEPSLVPGPHVQADVRALLTEPWDMIIAFPPCTHLARSGARWFPAKAADGRQQSGVDFFMLFTDLDCPRVAIENPIGIMSTRWRKPDQIINPWWFGDRASKATCLWLKGLPPLVADDIVDDGDWVIHGGRRHQEWYSNSKKTRSLTFPGVARAMADQWGRT